jgi:hypothetical protein
MLNLLSVHHHHFVMMALLAGGSSVCQVVHNEIGYIGLNKLLNYLPSRTSNTYADCSCI